MLIRTRFIMPIAAPDVFADLVDLDHVGEFIPGVTILRAATGPLRKVRVDVAVGVMRFSLNGVIEVAECDTQRRRAVLLAEGDDVAVGGTAKVKMLLEVNPHADGSEVTINTDVDVKGALAHLSTGLMELVAQELMEDFALRYLTSKGVAPSSGPKIGRSPLPDTVLRVSGLRLSARIAKRRLNRLWAGASSKRRWFNRRRTVDFIVAGSGSGALTAAVAAHDAELDVVIFEKTPLVGGGTAYSGGVVWAPCNHIMRAKGIEDSVENALTYLRHAADGRGDEALARRYVETVGSIIERVQAWTGIPWIIWPGQPDYYPNLPGASSNGRAILQRPASAHEILEPLQQSIPAMNLVRPTPHMDLVPGFQRSDKAARESWIAGRAIIGGLWHAVLQRGISYHVSTPVTRLIFERGGVPGVLVRHSDGREEEIRARYGVLLNTGGFDWNDEMAKRYLPGPKTFPQTPPGNTGDGHVMAMGLGAAVALMDKAVLHPAIRIPLEQHDGKPLYRMFNAELAKPHSMLVNVMGKRFASETAYFGICDGWNDVDQRLRGYPNVPSYMILDDQYRESYGLPRLPTDAIVPAWIVEADSLGELAAKLKIDVQGLHNEIATYNRDCANGIDTRFGRGKSEYERYWGDPGQHPNPTMGTISRAPFYGFEVHPSHAGTRGGVVITPDAQVKRTDGSIIQGLYACGNTAANLLFGAGYGSGASVGSSMVFGFHAAKHAIRMRDEATGGRRSPQKLAR
jgi:3-oxosteroid 1-dehydrogenase